MGECFRFFLNVDISTKRCKSFDLHFFICKNITIDMCEIDGILIMSLKESRLQALL
jgi:uncharacterized protein with PQ loop repeat